MNKSQNVPYTQLSIKHVNATVSDGNRFKDEQRWTSELGLGDKQ